MGISGLLGLLKSIQKPCKLSDFRNETIGVDTYCWLHRGAVAAAVELAQGKPTTKHVDFVMHRVRMLLHFGVKPYLVFDGDSLPSKEATDRARADRRRESKANGLRLLEAGQSALAFQELQKAVDVTPEMAAQLVIVLKQHNIPYVVAPYEADAQLAYLERSGFIQGIISEDSDLLVFGAQKLITKLDQYGECLVINKNDFTRCKEVNLSSWTVADLRHMAILSGCDYLAGIHRMGLKTAHRVVCKYKTVERIIRGIQLEGKFILPPNYIESFTKADMTFLYQWVFCPERQQLVHGNQPEDPQLLVNVECIGKYVEAPTAAEVATGQRHPTTKEYFALPSSPAARKPYISAREQLQSAKTSEKPIESFFIPRRTPLAELDPNSLTPISQRQGLVQTTQQSETVTPLRAPANSRSCFLRTTPLSMGRSKRPRLCEELFDLEPRSDNSFCRSRYFSGNKSSPGPIAGVHGGSITRKRKPSDFHIFSDDSCSGDLHDLMTKVEQSENQIVSDASCGIVSPNASERKAKKVPADSTKVVGETPEKTSESKEPKSTDDLDPSSSIIQHHKHTALSPEPQRQAPKTVPETPNVAGHRRLEEHSIEETPLHANHFGRSPLARRRQKAPIVSREEERPGALEIKQVGKRKTSQNTQRNSDLALAETYVQGSEHFLQRHSDETSSPVEDTGDFSETGGHHASSPDSNRTSFRCRLDLSQYVFALAS